MDGKLYQIPQHRVDQIKEILVGFEGVDLAPTDPPEETAAPVGEAIPTGEPVKSEEAGGDATS